METITQNTKIMEKTADQIVAELEAWMANLPTVKVKLMNDFLTI